MSDKVQVFTGNEIERYRLVTIKAGLKLLNLGIKPNRDWNSMAVLAQVTRVSGKDYANNQKGRLEAIAFLEKHLKQESD